MSLYQTVKNTLDKDGRKMMDKQMILTASEEEGFAKTALISTDEIAFEHEFRFFCEQNTCGNYNKNYGCPPYCGTPEEMEAKALRFENALVMQTRTPVKDVCDDKEMRKIKKIHTRMTFHMVEKLKKRGLDPDGIYGMCGPCNLCELCNMAEGKPCPHEEQRFSCLSAYCIDVTRLAKKCDMDIQWNGDVVSFFSIYFFGEKKNLN